MVYILSTVVHTATEGDLLGLNLSSVFSFETT